MSLVDVVVGDSALGSGELAEAVRVVGLLSRVVDASGGVASRPDLVEVVAGCQGLINALTAVQDVAIMRVAAIEEDWAEDGLIIESRRAPGHVALDAPDVVAGALRVSHLQAQRRVVLAARLAATGVDAEVEDAEDDDAEPAGVVGAGSDAEDAEDAGASPSGLGGVHEAMRDGRLDGYAASVIGEELEEAPAQVARAVVRAIEDWFGRECPSQLRRRCRRALVKISPDLLRQRAQRARAEAGLRRWAEEPGVDRWSGTFPSEQAAMGWAAVDALARRYVAEGVCERLEQARGKALIDLVTGNASIDVTVVVTTSETTDPAAPDGEGPGGEPDSPDSPDGEGPKAGPDGPDGRGPGAGPDGPRPDLERDDEVTPGSRHLEPDPEGSTRAAAPVPSAPAAADPQPVPRGIVDDELVEAYGPFTGDPMLVCRAWLVGLLRTGVRVRFARCHPGTGALLGEEDTATGAYRPGEKLKALVRTRDGRCRFPGCSVAARFCDLDHVRPWPAGPTTAANLMCLCRRHHRIKQRPGWSVLLAVDGTAAWTDPVGRDRTTSPRNHLDLLVLPAAAERSSPASAATAPTSPASAPPAGTAGTSATACPESTAAEVSTLETILEVLGDGYGPGGRPDRFLEPRPVHGDLIRPGAGRRRLTYHRGRTGQRHRVTGGPATSGPAPAAGLPPF